MTGVREAKTTTVPLAKAKDDPVFQEIDRRLRKLDPPIILEKWLTRVIKLHSTPLGGVDFEPTNADQLIACLKKVRDVYGEPAFTSDKIKDPMTGKVVEHGPLHVSMAVTEGVGLRQIYRMSLSEQPLVESDARSGVSMDGRFSALFGSSASEVKLSSLHWDIGRLKTNVHVDTTGFTMAVPGMGTFVTLDSAQHIANDLLLKTKLFEQGGLLRKIAERTSVEVLNSSNRFDPRAKISVDLVKGDIYKVTIKHTCNVYPDPNCFWGGDWSISGSVTGKNVRLDVEGRTSGNEKSITGTISGRHDIGGGDTGKRRR